MRYPKEQELQSLSPRDYDNIVVVCGTRYYSNRKQFHEKLLDYLEDLDGPILFISGAATSGADDMIIQWSKKFRYPCLEMPADWDNLGKRAGFVRNHAMGDIATHVIAYWDGQSQGTKDMIDYAQDKALHVKTVYIKVNNNERQKYPKTVFVPGLVVRSEAGPDDAPQQ